MNYVPNKKDIHRRTEELSYERRRHRKKSYDYIANGKGTHGISWEYSCDM